MTVSVAIGASGDTPDGYSVPLHPQNTHPTAPCCPWPGQRTDIALTHRQTREPPGCHISQPCPNQPQETGEVTRMGVHLTVPLPVPLGHKIQPELPALTASLPFPAAGPTAGNATELQRLRWGWFSRAFYLGKVKSLFLKRGNSSLVFMPADLGSAGKQRGAGARARGVAGPWDGANAPFLQEHTRFHPGRKLNVFTWNLRGLAKGL